MISAVITTLGLSLIGVLTCIVKCSQSKEYRVIHFNNREFIVTGQLLNDLVIEEINAGGEDMVNYSDFLAKHKVI